MALNKKKKINLFMEMMVLNLLMLLIIQLNTEHAGLYVALDCMMSEQEVRAVIIMVVNNKSVLAAAARSG